MSTPQSPDWQTLSVDVNLATDSFINGEPYSSGSNALLEHVDPVSKKNDYSFHNSGAKEVEVAVSAARDCYENHWSNTGPAARKKMLGELANLIDANADSIGIADCLDMGKPISAANQEAHIAAGFIRYYAEMIDKVYSGHSVPTGQGALELQVMRPRGVVGAITPWNFPVINVALKIGPALAAGNTVVIKPSELSSRSAILVAKLAIEAGLPAGAVNVITGDGVTGDLLARHTEVDMLTFTGSTATGKLLLSAIGQSSIKPILLECGGKSPEIIFPDAAEGNLDAIAQTVVRGAFWNQGQVCVARSRLLIHSSIYAELIEKIHAVASSMSVGNPLDVDCMFGPLASTRQQQVVEDFIESGIEDGANLILDGRNPAGGEEGCYVGPTIFTDVPANARIAQQEIFGPVLAIFTFDDDDQALALANDSEYGLAATIWTKDIVRANRLASQIKVGKVKIVATPAMVEGPMFSHSAEPCGQSGYGVEGGSDGLFSYMRKQSIEFAMG